MRVCMSILATADPEIFAAIEGEKHREVENIELIASENYPSSAVLEAQGSVLTNKYAEGYPGRRYYGGCEWVDVVERLAIERACTLFGAQHANVQPHSGSTANIAAYLALLNHGDTVLGLSLSHGGHLTHGSPVNYSGLFYNFVAYGVRPSDERLDYDEIARLAEQHRPKLVLAGASAYSREIDFARLSEIARSVGARFMVDMAHIAGLVAAGVHQNPVPYADVVTTTTHKTLRGPRSGMILCTEELAKDIDKRVFPGTQGGPLMHIIAAKAVAFREALQPSFREYQQNVVANARELAAGLQAEGFHIISGGTDNHLLVLDLRGSDLHGRQCEQALDAVGITASRSTIPFDPLPPAKASGMRFGTPAVTTRGMGLADMREIATLIATTIRHQGDAQILDNVTQQVRALTARFPVPGISDRTLAAV